MLNKNSLSTMKTLSVIAVLSIWVISCGDHSTYEPGPIITVRLVSEFDQSDAVRSVTVNGENCNFGCTRIYQRGAHVQSIAELAVSVQPAEGYTVLWATPETAQTPEQACPFAGSSALQVTFDQLHLTPTTVYCTIRFVRTDLPRVSVEVQGLGSVSNLAPGVSPPPGGTFSCEKKRTAIDGTLARCPYFANGVAVLYAQPASGWRFTRWEGDCVAIGSAVTSGDPWDASTPSIRFTVPQESRCRAVFEAQRHDLQVRAAMLVEHSSGSVIVDGPDDAKQCSGSGRAGASCGWQYDHDTTVTLRANPGPNSQFVRWTGDCSGTSAQLTISLRADTLCVAVFDAVSPPSGQATLSLTVLAEAHGIGTVSLAPGGGNFPCTLAAGQNSATCSATFAQFAMVTLTPTPDSGAVFSGWSGDCSGSGPITVTLDQSKQCTATFSTLKNSLTLTVFGLNGARGMVSASPSSLFNPDAFPCSLGDGENSKQCVANYPGGVSVTLTATPAPGSIFHSWQGDCIGETSSSVSITLAHNANCQAIFQPAAPVVDCECLIGPNVVTPTGEVYESCEGSLVSDPNGVDQRVCACQRTSGPGFDDLPACN